MTKRKDCFGKYPASSTYSKIRETPSGRVRSKASTTYTCRTEKCPYMHECVLASVGDPIESYKRKESRTIPPLTDRNLETMTQ